MKNLAVLARPGRPTRWPHRLPAGHVPQSRNNREYQGQNRGLPQPFQMLRAMNSQNLLFGGESGPNPDPIGMFFDQVGLSQ